MAEGARAAVMIMMMAMAAATLVSVASAIQGTATFYTPPYVPSSCNGFQNDGVMIAAASDAIWNNRAACNKRYSVRCTGATNAGVPHPCRGGSIVVKIVDYCPPGCQGTFDLSQEAFAMIADPNAGKIQIEYTEV
ncbi:EG45-like domain containing protein [Durio zibethinus]|uniref:EG45-like domain containing protein n=1 Tax=Durio zibethinus TaxID=66656 RepID=A0A6P5ZFR7_DURZI|nr:EG45-like domain containing protein [Durio zibethinus]